MPMKVAMVWLVLALGTQASELPPPTTTTDVTSTSLEMVQNGDLEAPLTESEAQGDTPGWSLLTLGDAEGSMKLDDTQPLEDSNPHSLKLTVTRMGDRCGIVNSGLGGMAITKGQWYDITFYAHATDNRSVGLVFSFESEDGTVCARATLPEVGRGRRPQWGQPPAEDENPWKQYRLSVPGWASASDCRMIVTPIEPVTMWFDKVSVLARQTNQ